MITLKTREQIIVMTKFIRDQTEQPAKSTRLSRAAQTFLLTLTLSLVAAFAAWLSFVALCTYDRQIIGLCRHPAGGWLVMVGTLALLWSWIALQQADRLRRRLRKGLYGRPGRSFRLVLPGFSGKIGRNLDQIFRNAVHFIWEGELPPAWIAGRQHPALYHNRAGWWVEVPMDGGRRVWVGQQVFYEWLVQVMAVKNDLMPGESAIGERLWAPLVGRPQWYARCQLLQKVGAAIWMTDHPSSRRLVRTDVLGILEDLEEARPVEEN